MSYWVMKSEPSVYGIDDLAAQPLQTDHWEGVRNYQARNMLRDLMQPGDLALFYHSNCPQPGVVGIMQIVRAGYPDHTAFDPESKYFDPKSDLQQPRWYMVDVRLERRLARTIPLAELKTNLALVDMLLIRRGNRLSIMPATPEQWQAILDMEHTLTTAHSPLTGA
ncbi:MAG TPA: EVE domain-containing protein [Nitrococcus sp.]|nr:EVE domain-containing protein [Nitrococcus sp.]